MSNNITIKDANNTNVALHTIEDSTSVHFNQSIPTDIANNTATVVSGGQAVASGMGALVVAQRDALPAGTNLIGGVSVRGISDVSVSPNGLNIPVSIAGTINVATHAVTQSGAWTVSVNDKVSVAGVVAATQSGTWNVGLNAGANLIGAVSISPNGLNIPVSLAPPAYNLPVSVHPVTQSGTWNVGLNAGTNLIGAVSVRGNIIGAVSIANIADVSVSPNGLNIPVSLAPPAYNLPVSVHPVTQSGTWNVGLNAGTNLIGAVSISPNGLNIPVSLAPPTFNVPVSIAAGRVSTAGLVSVWDANTVVPDTDAKVLQGFQHSIAITAGYVFNRISNTWDRMTGTSVGLAIVGTVSVTGPLPAGTNHLGKVSVEGLSITGIGTQLVSVGGPVSTQGVQIVGRDGSGNARVPYVDASGIARVSIEGSLAVSGSSMTQTVGAAVTTEGYPMLGSDGTNARRLLTTTNGALVVHVSNTAPGGGAGGSTMTQTVGAAVTTEGYPMLGSDGTNARRLLTTTAGAVVVHVSNLQPAISVAGIVSVVPDGTANWPVSIAPPTFNLPVSVHPVTQSGTWNVGLNAGTNLVGAVSISPNGLNIPVSVANIPAVTQSGTWNVGINAGTNLIGAVSVRGTIIGSVSIANIADVSISPNGLNIPVSLAPPTYNLPVSVHPVTQSGTWNVGLNAGTNLIGAVSISPNGLNIPVSLAPPAYNLPVSVHPVTQSGTWNVGALTSINSIVKVSIEGNLAVSGSSMTHTVGTAVTTEGYPMLGSDGTNSRRLLTTTGGALIVHVSNTAPGGSTGGSTQLVSVGGPVSTQGVQVVGTDGTNARTLLTTTGGALVVHVSNTAPGGASGGGGTVMASIGGAVSNQAVQIAGSDTQNNARTIKTNVSGAVFISTRTFMSQATFTRPADTTAYAAGATAAPGNAGDLIANSTTNTAVTPLKFRVARSTGQNGGVAYIRGARMFRTGGGLATGQHNIAGAIRLHLFNTNNRVSVANGDNGAFNASPVSNWMGYIDLVAIACAPGLRTSGAVSTQVYWGSPARTGEMLVNLSATQVSIQGLLETRVAFTPIASEVFTVQIEGFNG